MSTIIHWDKAPTQELKTYVLARRGPLSITTDVGDPPVKFVEYSKHVFETVFGYHMDHYNFWVSVLDPVNDPTQAWMPKFPHNHGYDGLTLVQYLQTPEEGGELVRLDEKLNELQRYTPRVGDGAIIVNHEVHGVRAVRGSRPRITIIAGGYPYPAGHGKCRCGWDGNLVVS